MKGTNKNGDDVHHCVCLDGKTDLILDSYDEYQLTLSASALEACVGTIVEFVEVRQLVEKARGKRKRKNINNKANQKRKTADI